MRVRKYRSGIDLKCDNPECGGLKGGCRDCDRWRRLWAEYRLTKRLCEGLRSFQSGRCAICRRPESGSSGKGFHIDHDHECCDSRMTCGSCVRGMLCGYCNMYLLSGYEKLPPELKGFSLLDSYLADPPFRQMLTVGQYGSSP
ncbi:endonuclease domain-containing protein [Streptomyces sp. NPDC094438]|uniref:endonuclease domain-containing protein n=1 Tax=Streptomyces sp. NPDC094438 TaxID=3366061 RepID=UPI0037F44CA3